jgi:hypothetical protein
MVSAPPLASPEPEVATAGARDVTKPYVPVEANLPELTPLPLILGTLLGAH